MGISLSVRIDQYVVDSTTHQLFALEAAVRFLLSECGYKLEDLVLRTFRARSPYPEVWAGDRRLAWFDGPPTDCRLMVDAGPASEEGG